MGRVSEGKMGRVSQKKKKKGREGRQEKQQDTYWLGVGKRGKKRKEDEDVQYGKVEESMVKVNRSEVWRGCKEEEETK